MAKLCIYLLGPYRVTLDGEPVTGFGSDKGRALLAYLAAEAAEPHRRERLAGLIWPEFPERSARTSLRSALANVRQVIGDRDAATPYIHAGRQTIQFNDSSDALVDVITFGNLVDRSASGATDPCGIQDLERAVQLYRGEFLESFSLSDSVIFEDWALLKRERLQRQVLETLHRVAAHYEEENDFDKALPLVWREVELDPWREEAQRRLMRLLALNGQRSAALAQYEVCLRSLREELDVAPSRATTRLYEQIRDGGIEPATPPRSPSDVAGELASFPGSTAERRTNLPVQPTPFVGREALLAEIGARLDEPTCRLLTLVGAGGSGKTRLALEAAAAQLETEAYEHGVFFVSLAPLDDAEAIVPTVAQAVGFSVQVGGGVAQPRRQLLNHLRHKSLLLLMDNFEHLLDGATLLTEILQAAPGVRVLATSRANLNLPEEHLFPIPGMAYPEGERLGQAADYGAVKLFLETARRARPHFEAKGDKLREVVRICRLVDGMPLGIMLAAGWVRMLSLAEIASEIDKSLDFLETDVKGVPERQRGVRAVFDHSWRLLSAREGEVMAALSVFRGGFTRRAAGAVTGATLRELKGLVDKSLVAHTATGRYDLHRLLRQYAADKLRRGDKRKAEAQALKATRDRHSAYFVAFLERRGEELKGPRQQTALAEIEADGENARAAWDWAVEHGQVEWLDQGLDGLCLFYERTGRFERGDRACHRAAERLAEIGASAGPPALARAHARALTWRAVYHDHLGRYESARQLLRSSLSLLDEAALADVDVRRERAFALRQEGNITMWLGEYERARGLFEGSLALYRELGDRWGTAIALVGLGYAACNVGATAEWEAWTREALALRRALGDQRGIAYALYPLSLALKELGQYEEAGRLARESIAISRETGDRINLAWGLGGMGVILMALGKNSESLSVLEESASIWEDLESPAWRALPISRLGFAEMHLGRYQDACVRLQLSLRLARETGHKSLIRDSLVTLGFIALAERAYDKARCYIQESLTVAPASGWHRHMEEIRFGLGLGLLELGQGNLGPAREHLSAGLKIVVEHWTDGGWWGEWWIAAIALLLAEQGDAYAERGVELYALASRYPVVANSHYWEDLAGKRIIAIAGTLPPEAVAAARERGRARDMAATAQELLAELDC